MLVQVVGEIERGTSGKTPAQHFAQNRTLQTKHKLYETNINISIKMVNFTVIVALFDRKERKMSIKYSNIYSLTSE